MSGLAYYSSPLGELLIESDADKIVTVNFVKDAKQGISNTNDRTMY